MSVVLFWVVSPTSEISNGIGFLESLGEGNRVLDSFRSKSLMGNDRFKKGLKNRGNYSSMNADSRFSCFRSLSFRNGGRVGPISCVVAGTTGDMALSSEQKVYDVVLKQAALVKRQLGTSENMEVKPEISIPGSLSLLGEAYNRCGEVCAEYAKTFYLGTMLMTPQRRKAIWAIYEGRPDS